jgi:hypothetical protein
MKMETLYCPKQKKLVWALGERGMQQQGGGGGWNSMWSNQSTTHLGCAEGGWKVLGINEIHEWGLGARWEVGGTYRLQEL